MMLKTERQDEIMNILKQKKHVSIDYLVKQIYASTITIRRDLRNLEALGLVKRCYGGVSLLDYENKVVPLTIREDEMRREKGLIARQAVAMIKEGDVVFMDASSTVLRMIDYIEDNRKITVVTNNIKAVAALCERHIPVYSTGGKLLDHSLACVGAYAIRMIESTHADILFFSSQGLSASGDITDFSESETHLRQVMLKQAKKKVFLCDSGKLGKVFPFTVCHVHDLDAVICDQPVDFDQPVTLR